MRIIFVIIAFLALFSGFILRAQPRKEKFEVIGYYSGNGNNIHDYDVSGLTQVIFSFLHLKDDTLSFSSPDKMEALRKTVALKKKFPELKVLVSLGGWGGCKTCSETFGREESRMNFAASVTKVMAEYGVDGIDLDWEYPAIEGYPEHPFHPKDRDNFTDLILKIRAAIGQDGQLSFAAGGFTKYLEQSVDWEAVMPAVNRVNLMTYDLVGGYSKVTGHHTALFSTPKQIESTDHCVQWLLKRGVPSYKLVIGAAFYARIWEGVEKKDWGLYQPGSFKQALDYKDYYRLEPDSGWSHHWDMKAMAPYAYHKSQGWFATYDNAISLQEKVLYAQKNRLGGIMFWELQCDLPKNGLLMDLYRSVQAIQNKP